jgi:hypothetical protein
MSVNVGAGTVVLSGWINTDVLWRSDMYLDLTWPTSSGTVGMDTLPSIPLTCCRYEAGQSDGLGG